MAARITAVVVLVAAACAGAPVSSSVPHERAATTSRPAATVVRANEPDIEGYWTGALERRGGMAPFAMTLRRGGDGLEAVVDAPSWRLLQVVLPARLAEGALELQLGSAQLRLRVDAEAGQLRGLLSDANLGVDIRVELRRGVRPAEPPVVTEPVEFTSADGVVLSGSAVLPDGAGPFPGIVFVQGRSYGSRMQFLAHAVRFARRGVAAIVFDGRGVGSSGGVAGKHTLANRLDDATAAFDLLAADPRVDATRVGMLGHSAGGWVVPVIARSRPLAFLVLHSAPAEPLPAQQGHVVQALMKRSGASFAAGDYAAAFAYQRRLVAMIGAGAPWPDIAALAATAEGQPWAEYASVPRSEQDEQLGYYRRVSHDSTEALQATTIPILALFGEEDWIVPPAVNVPLLQSHLTRAGNRDYEIVVFPAAGHDLMIPERGADSEQGYRWPTVPPDYFETLIDWVSARVVGS